MRIIPIITGIFGAALVILLLCVVLVIMPAFTRLAEENARQESIRVASHLAATTFAEDGPISGRRLSKEFSAEAEKIRQDFRLLRLRVFASSGEIIFSTSAGEIGNFNKKWDVFEKVAKGLPFSQVVRRGHETLEGELVRIDVAETYVPLARDGKVLGAFEIYYDISERIANLDKVMVRTNLLLFSVVAVLLTFVTVFFSRARRSLIERDLAREEWARTFEAVTDPVMIVTRNFTIARANKAMAEWIGVNTFEAIGLTCHQKVHHCSEPIADCPHKKLLEDGTVHSADIFDQHSGRYFSITVYPLFDSHGRLA
jgi:PAS domain-containing protein